GVVELVLRLENTAPDGVVALPGSVTGGGKYGVPAGVIRTVVYVYLPEGLLPSSLDPGTFAAFTPGVHDGRPVLATWVDLSPGEDAVTTVRVPLPSGEPSLVMTPLLPR